MKSLQDVIAEKRQQLVKLQAQLEVLEELAGEETGGSTRRAKQDRAPGGRRRRGRSPRGANQEKVLSVLTASPMRLRDIVAAAGLKMSAVNSVIHAAMKKGLVAKGSARGTYSLKKRSDGPSKVERQRKRRTRRTAARRTAKKTRKSPSQAAATPSGDAGAQSS